MFCHVTCSSSIVKFLSCCIMLRNGSDSVEREKKTKYEWFSFSITKMSRDERGSFLNAVYIFCCLFVCSLACLFFFCCWCWFGCCHCCFSLVVVVVVVVVALSCCRRFFVFFFLSVLRLNSKLFLVFSFFPAFNTAIVFSL